MFPAVEVEDVVVAAAEEYEVVGSGVAAVFPVDDVVGFAPRGGSVGHLPVGRTGGYDA